MPHGPRCPWLRAASRAMSSDVKFATAAQLAFVLLAAVAVFGFVRTGMDAERRRVCAPLCTMRPDYAGLNRLAPDFELAALGGGRVRLSDYRGKAVILNFWTKTCAPCLKELPSLRELGHTLSSHPQVELITISTDPSLADVQATLKSVLGADLPFVVLVDPEAAVVTNKYGTKLFPETWYIDPQGVIRARFDGARDWGQALAVDLAETLLGPSDCGVEFRRGRAIGRLAGVCD